ncbi:MAG: hypothetical protein B6D55_02355 [Candidatus Omnitrophica bacterium 4484_70.2]|nr:MAG: hypothetical protein B6D55_02355 [Candidatus Omnitrophica bacterium 4484_70.2]
MNERLKAIINLALGGAAVYFLLKSREAEKIAEEERKKREELEKKLEELPFPIISEKAEKMPPGVIYKEGKIIYIDKWGRKHEFNMNPFIERFPFLRHLEFQSLPLRYISIQ